MVTKDNHAVQNAGALPSGPPLFLDRESEAHRLNEALRARKSLAICGPAGVGKTAFVMQVLQRLPADLEGCCLYLRSMKDLQDVLRQLIRGLYDRKDPHLRRQLRAEGISRATFEGWLKRLSTSQMKGTLYRTVEQGDYRIFLDHLPPLAYAVAKVIKELHWMRNTPVYLLVRDEVQQHLGEFYSFFYWGKGERLTLPPLPARAAAQLLESCIEWFGLSALDLSDFREEALELSKRIPGAIIKMCALAANRRYQYGSCIKVRSVYIDYLMNTTPYTARAVSLSESREDGLD